MQSRPYHAFKSMHAALGRGGVFRLLSRPSREDNPVGLKETIQKAALLALSCFQECPLMYQKLKDLAGRPLR